jgi:hypothetical protein
LLLASNVFCFLADCVGGSHRAFVGTFLGRARRPTRVDERDPPFCPSIDNPQKSVAIRQQLFFAGYR